MYMSETLHACVHRAGAPRARRPTRCAPNDSGARHALTPHTNTHALARHAHPFVRPHLARAPRSRGHVSIPPRACSSPVSAAAACAFDVCPVAYHTRAGAPARQRERLPARHLDGAVPRAALCACFQLGRPRTRARGTATARAQRNAARDCQPHLGHTLPLSYYDQSLTGQGPFAPRRSQSCATRTLDN